MIRSMPSCPSLSLPVLRTVACIMAGAVGLAACGGGGDAGIVIRPGVPATDETPTPAAEETATGADGVERELDLSHVVLLKGTIAGDPDSLAFLSVTPDQVSGTALPSLCI